MSEDRQERFAAYVDALAEEDDVASQLRDEELRNAAAQIRNLSAAHKGR